MNREKLKLILVIAGSMLGAWFLFYLLLLPKFISSDFVVNGIKNIVNQQTGLSLTLEKPVLKTHISPKFEFSFEDLALKNGDKELMNVKDFDTQISFGKILKHEIGLDRLRAKSLFINGNNALELVPTQETTQPMPETDWNVDISKAKLQLDSGLIKYNNSQVVLSSLIENENVEITAKSDNFLVADIFDLVNTNLLIPDGKEMLAPLVKPSGAVSMDIRLNNNGINGKVNMKNAKACLKDLTNLPLVMPKGTITITPDQLAFSNFEGYYGKNSSNKIKVEGTIKDYYKTFDSNLTIDTIATNEFFSDYLAGLLGGTAIKINKNIPTRLIYKAINNEMNITWLTKIAKGVSFGVDDTPSPLDAYDRAIKGDFSLIGNTLDIKNINYYIAQDIHKGMGKIDPILVFDGKMDVVTGELFNAGFSFGREMPSEFLNVFAGQKLFKGGTIKGDLHVAFENKIPKLDANMEIAKTRIPSQRLYIKDATLTTTRNDINLSARGGFKRIRYDIAGVLKNELLTPIIVRDLDMNLDKVDVERLMNSLSNPQQLTAEVPVAYTNDDDETGGADDDFMFDTNLIVIEDCTFRLKEGSYKNLNFGNIEANMTLDKDGIFNLQSNKFDIADGISTLKVNCDLKTLKYYLRLGVKDVDSDIFSTALLNLSKEISGKASGLIELTSDASMKLNGSIKFLVNNGTIGKIGLVEYLMKVASIFRNPVVMISPTTIMDLVNIPEGKFDRIYGELTMKDNVIERMNIESSSPTLSALIRGRYDLEKQDASLRIYTRFSNSHKGIAGFFRNFSLNALANKVKLNGRNDANYYASELADLPEIDAKEEDTQVFLTQVEGDVEHNNFLSSLKKIK
ncbi:MAG: AsmA-like C-terminal region-containing protein [Fusobacterium sp.]|nr:AsmA-like C-terminal region-containing protein [Fusobacterium sp.]